MWPLMPRMAAILVVMVLLGGCGSMPIESQAEAQSCRDDGGVVATTGLEDADLRAVCELSTYEHIRRSALATGVVIILGLGVVVMGVAWVKERIRG